MILDRVNFRLVCGGSSADLTRAEYYLAEYLSDHPGMVRSRAQIIEAVYGNAVPVENRSVDTIVKRVRQKARAVGGVDPILTRYDFGYAWRG